jgi:hypothetical protein
LTCGGKDRIQLYTSPSVFYFVLRVEYLHRSSEISTQEHFENSAAVPAEARFQNLQREIGWENEFGEAPISSHFSNKAIERHTKARGITTPYRFTGQSSDRRDPIEEEAGGADASGTSGCVDVSSGGYQCGR